MLYYHYIYIILLLYYIIILSSVNVYIEAPEVTMDTNPLNFGTKRKAVPYLIDSSSSSPVEAVFAVHVLRHAKVCILNCVHHVTCVS